MPMIKLMSCGMRFLVNGLKKKNYLFHVYLHVDGNNPIVTGVRNHIFRRELPLALEAIRYGDRKFLSLTPN